MDQLQPIQELGYTYREAAFLYFVAKASGFFLARQFNEFILRREGGLTHAFVNKLRERGHATVVNFGQRRFVYHLRLKTIYAILGIPDSQSRRMKSDKEILLRLMILDYLVDRLRDRLLLTHHDKVEFFSNIPWLNRSDLPAKTFVVSGAPERTAERLFVERYPISIKSLDSSDHGLVTFSYFDCGEYSQSFAAFLDRYELLFGRCFRFKLDYVALDGSRFPKAQHCFEQRFGSENASPSILPRGIEHLTSYFRARHLFDGNDARFSNQDLIALREGERLYASREHERLWHAWKQGKQPFDAELRRLSSTASTTRGQIELCILQRKYPIYGWKTDES